MVDQSGEIPRLLLVGGPNFHTPASSPRKWLALAWRRLGGEVIYLEFPDRTPDGSEYPADSKSLMQQTEGLEVVRLVPIPWMPWSYPAWVLTLNLWHNGIRLRRELRRRGFTPGTFIALYYGWFWSDWVGKFGAAADVYDCTDEHKEYSRLRGRSKLRDYVWQAERRMIERVDLVAATSEVLLRERAPLARMSILLPHAVNAEILDTSPCESTDPPRDLAGLPRPIGILVGNLEPKLDTVALATLAKTRPDAGLAVIGPMMQKGMALPDAANVRWLGSKPYSELRRYFAHASVGILPLRANAFNMASSPLKLQEYLAAGLPVVASRTPYTEEWARRYPEFIHIADGPDDFPPAFQRAIDSGRRFTRAQIRAAVEKCTYERRVLDLISAAKAAASRGSDARPRNAGMF